MATNVISMCSLRSLRTVVGNSFFTKFQHSVNKRFLFRMNTSSPENSTSSPPGNDEKVMRETGEKQPNEPAQNEGQGQLSEKEKSLLEENKKLTELVTDIDDKYKRALAEAENTRVRMRKQAEEAKLYGIQNFCKDLLDVADVLNKAIETVPKEALESKNDVLKNLFEGVRMTEQQLQNVFKRHGLTQINPIGEKFNPNEHHALCQAEEAGKEPNTIAFVSKIGYKLHDRTIRPAMVGVYKTT